MKHARIRHHGQIFNVQVDEQLRVTLPNGEVLQEREVEWLPPAQGTVFARAELCRPRQRAGIQGAGRAAGVPQGAEHPDRPPPCRCARPAWSICITKPSWWR